MPNWLHTSLFVLTQAVILVGLFGLIVPVFPGVVIIWLATLGYGIVKGFSTLGIVLFVIITLLMVGGTLVDNVLMGAGARKQGASWSTIIVALVAGVLGTLFFPPIGGLIAAPLAVLALEYMRSKDINQAWNALKGLAAGWGMSFVARFAIGLVMMGLWWAWVWLG
jgi:uncharacterized protein YqgC (DUF456 family)